MSHFDLSSKQICKQQFHQSQLNYFQQKYINHQKNINQNHISTLFKTICHYSFIILENIWNFTIPTFIRGKSAQYDKFIKLWMQNYPQSNTPQQIQKDSLQKILSSKMQKNCVLLGLCYTQKQLPRIKKIIEKLKSQKIQLKILILPIYIQGKIFKQIFQPNLQYIRDSILVLHKNLIEELISLKQFSFEEQITLDNIQFILNKQIEIEQKAVALNLQILKSNKSCFKQTFSKKSIKIRCQQAKGTQQVAKSSHY